MILLSVLIPLALFAAIYYYFSYMPGAQSEWEKLPTLDVYLARHPAKNNIITCHNCRHTGRMDIGLVQISDYRRKIICTQCKTTLWREQD
ncbi:hypothetical protein CSQ88_08300 [Iodobacter sp. BJB302]|nr:hypothetical protein CSQ88_08300 [Iodobacter sp. BJB302]